MAQTDSREANIERLLKNLRGLDALKRLLYSELNFDRANTPISTREWTDAQRDGLGGDPTIIAANNSQFGGFDVIYASISDWARARSIEREVTSVLLRNFPYALFIFSNQDQNVWHFVNVKYAKDSSSRRLIRRITVARGERLRTASERIAMLDISDLGRDLFGISPLAIQARHDEAFDVEAVTNQFFRDFERVFNQGMDRIQGIPDEEDRRLFTQTLFNRLMFIVFLERKGWLSIPGMEDTNYLRGLWDIYRQEQQKGTSGSDNFYQSRLKTLFFLGLNTPNEINIIGAAGHDRTFVHGLIGHVPYLNGGLFEEGGDDRNSEIFVPDSVLELAIDDLFYRYNFTVTESTPFDIEVAVDPEMLGKIFEELVTGRHESGSYYTPKPIVAYMGREALKGYLTRTCEKESETAIAAFVDDRDASGLRNAEAVLDALKEVKICDPACGSGAYLLGMMQELLELRQALFAAHEIDDVTTYNRKLEIIQQNVYGVDLYEFAVNIARLRLWLSLIVDYDDKASTPPPLPNLDYKVEVGNSLTGAASGLTLWHQNLIAEFRDLKGHYLISHGGDKKALKIQIDNVRKQIVEELRASTRTQDISGFDWQIEFAEVFEPDDSGDFGGFDIVLANPPYVRQELIGAEKASLKLLYGSRYSSMADLFVYFYFRGLEILKSGGQLAFISSNKWMRAKYGEKLRAYLLTQTSVRIVVDFGDLPLFSTATTYPSIIIVEKTEPSPHHSVRALNVNNLSIIDTLMHSVRTSGWNQLQSSLGVSNWTLSQPQLLTLLEKLKQRSIPLASYVEDNIYRGIVTGLTEAFTISAETRQKLIDKDSNSEKIIKPWLRGRDIKRWMTRNPGQYVIFTRRGIDINEFPAIRDYLEEYRSRLTPGVKGGRKPGSYAWYEIQDNIAYYEEFSKPKIIYQKFQVRPVFLFDREGHYVNDSIWMMTLDDYFLLGYLNSDMAWFEISRNCTQLQNGYQLIWDYFQNVRVPNPRKEIRDRIADIARELSEGRDSNRQMQLEVELNQLAYQAFDLTDEEIKIIHSQMISRAVSDIAALIVAEKSEE